MKNPNTVTVTYQNPDSGRIVAETTMNLVALDYHRSITVSTLGLQEEITLLWSGHCYVTELLGMILTIPDVKQL